jgi:hypothetical protein
MSGMTDEECIACFWSIFLMAPAFVGVILAIWAVDAIEAFLRRRVRIEDSFGPMIDERMRRAERWKDRG